MPEQNVSAPRGRFTYRIPPVIWVVGLLLGILHMAPYWRASLQTQAGWHFTGNMSSSPDYMQYRVWSRQTQQEGVFVSNRFTAEANRRHLPVPLYYAIGQISRMTGATPEWVYAWLGGVAAVCFAVLLYAAVRYFLPDRQALAWVYGLLLLGGGMGGYLKFMQESPFFQNNYLLNSLFIEPLYGPARTVPFEEYRGNYIVQAIFDSHFLVYWTATLVAVLALYNALRRPSVLHTALAALAFAFGTFLHVYEGITLMGILAGVIIALLARGVARRPVLVTAAACAAAVGLCVVVLAAIYRQSGLRPPAWRGVNVDFPIVIMAYPLAFALIAWGIARYWRESGTDGAFLLGWALGCLAQVLSGPFFPHPARGTMSLQIPLFIIAGSIYFARRRKVGVIGVIVLLLTMGATTAWTFKGQFERTTFDGETHKWLTDAHLGMIRQLRERAGPGDVLLAEEEALRWLAPEYPGVHYAGHFFLTVDYERKIAELQRFFTSPDPVERAAFLRRNGIRYMYVTAAREPAGFESLPGLRVVQREAFGTLFEFAPEGGLP
jgi:hypothetical protein